MTDHLDEAAAKAITAAGRLLHDDDPKDRIEAAAHLTYMAGLLRGMRPPPVTPGRCDAAGDGWRGVPLACHLNAGHTGEHMHSDGTRWGEIPAKFYPAGGGGPYEDYVTSIRSPEATPGRTAPDSDIKQERDRFRTQRDELLSAVRKVLEQSDVQTGDDVLCELAETYARVRES